jgi:hypothetical protein
VTAHALFGSIASVILERLAEARTAIRTKTKAAIEAETAATWGARAIAAYEQYRSTGSFDWLAQAIEYEHEAIEHAASGPPGTLEQIQTELAQAKHNVWT